MVLAYRIIIIIVSGVRIRIIDHMRCGRDRRRRRMISCSDRYPMYMIRMCVRIVMAAITTTRILAMMCRRHIAVRVMMMSVMRLSVMAMLLIVCTRR